MLFRVENCNYSYVCLGDLCCPFQLSQPLQSCTLGVATSPWCFRRFLPRQFTAAVWGPLFPALFHVFMTLKGQSVLLPSFSFPSPNTKILLNILTHTIWGRLGNRFICKTWHTSVSYGEMLKGDFLRSKNHLECGPEVIHGF